VKIQYHNISINYEIPLKLYEPDIVIKGYIIAVHGFCGDMESSTIQALAARMVQNEIAVTAFDFVGHGKSEADKHFSLSACKRDMSDVMRYMQQKYNGEKPIGIFATSFGGYITLLNSDNIPSTTKLVLRAPAVYMAESFLKFVPDYDEFQNAGKCEMGFERKLSVPFSFYDELRSNSALMTNYDRPILVIYGDQDDVVNFSDIEAFCTQNPKAVLKVISGADHRFKGKDELEQVIELSEKYILN